MVRLQEYSKIKDILSTIYKSRRALVWMPSLLANWFLIQILDNKIILLSNICLIIFFKR